ncbi:MAG: alpha/beta hydrolase [Promethearchaeota archaeon]|nr:MAG: alpha/beta hydrolase [Candidatus Lokiarchaeota archaeon]
MEIPDYSHLREDLAKALTHNKMLWNDGMRDFCEKNHIPLDTIIKKIETIEDPNLVLRVRRYIDDYTQNIVPRPADIEYRRELIGTIPVEWIKAKNTLELPLILFFHGGGYIFGGLEASWQLPSQLSKIANINILSVNYRHGPEYPYPAALDDAIAVYDYLLHEKALDPNKIVVSGASAGGGLALALLLRLRDEKKLLPVGAALFSPWTDLRLKGASIKTNKDIDPDLTKTDLMMCASLYSGSPRLRKLPYLSPVLGDFSGLPPLLVDAGEKEILLDDSSRLVENAQEVGVEIHFKVWKDMNHVFHSLFAHIPEPNQAFIRVAEFIKGITMY